MSDPASAPPVVREDLDGRRFRVRPLREDDRPALEAFYGAFEPKRVAQGLPPQGTERIARWLDAILPRGIHLAVHRDDALIGHALVVPTAREGTFEYAVFLHKDERGRGIGTELARLSVEAARAAGVRRLWLSVEPHNRAAIRSYEKVGFRFVPGTTYSAEAEMEMEV